MPKLRFPEFEGEWETTRFGQVINIGNGQVDPKQEPFASMMHVSPDRIVSGSGRLEGVMTAKEDGITSGKYQFDEHALIYSKIRPNLNKVAKPGFAGICSADMYPIWAVDGKAETDFLAQLMRDGRFVDAATAVSMRTGMPKINRPDSKQLTVVIPNTIIEQKKIAAFLGVVDGKIVALRARVAGLERYKRGLMQALFSQTLRFTNPDGSPFPDWEEKRLGDILTVKYGKDHKGLPDGNIPVYGTGGVMRYVDRALSNGPSVMIGRKGTIDKPSFVTKPFWTVDTLFYSEISKNVVCPH